VKRVVQLSLIVSCLMSLQSIAADERLAPCDVLTGGVLVAPHQILVVGIRGQILSKSLANANDDCGIVVNNGWQVAGSAQGQWTGLKSVGADHWMLGHRQALYQAQADMSWQRRHWVADSDYALMDITYAHELGRYLAVGTRGVYLTSEDGGQSWLPQDLYLDPEWDEPEDFNLNAIVALGDRKLLVVGEAGALYWSKDGDEWRKDHAGYDGTWFGATGLADGGVVTFGFAGHVAFSRGYRKDWTVVQGPARATLFASLALDDGSVLLAGERGVLWRWSPYTDQFAVITTNTQATITALLLSQVAGQQQLLLITDRGLKRIAYPHGG